MASVGTIVSNILYYKLSSGLYCGLKIGFVGCSTLRHKLFKTAVWKWSDTHTQQDSSRISAKYIRGL